MKNTVYNYLQIQGYKVKTGQFCKGNEIDFIVEKEAEIKYIQVARTIKEEVSQKREFGNIEKLKDNYEKIVVTFNDTFPNTFNGIKTCNLLEFLISFK